MHLAFLAHSSCFVGFLCRVDSQVTILEEDAKNDLLLAILQVAKQKSPKRQKSKPRECPDIRAEARVTQQA